MREMLNPTSAIAGMGLGSSVALITDGRFRCELPEEHLSDMFHRRQQLADQSHLIEEGDIIKIDIPNMKLGC